MTKNEFITLQSEDLKALKNAVYNHILMLFENYLPDDIDISDKCSIPDFYNLMFEYAKKKQVSGSYCIDSSSDEFFKLMNDYFNIKINQKQESKKESKAISLEDFF